MQLQDDYVEEQMHYEQDIRIWAEAQVQKGTDSYAENEGEIEVNSLFLAVTHPLAVSLPPSVIAALVLSHNEL